MPSILPNFEYDIFISYRHNDNLDGWVTAFVESLEKELKGTLKDSLSIYFDRNPHDGLLETHNVDKSLEGKLKCLIFIPILSQTYCDPKSFAWQHEFVAFNQMANGGGAGESPLRGSGGVGRDIKLPNGNVASRILPIKIHDLDAEDKSIIENEIGGVLRAIEFIYKTPGVNRPLTSSDKKEDNATKTFYKDQLNKVANAIKEIIVALKNPTPNPPTTTNQQLSTNPPKPKTKFILAGIALLLVAALYFLYPKFISKTSSEEAIDKSVAVLPFADMSPNHDQEYFGDGVAEEIINVLAHSKELKVISRSSSFQFKQKNEDTRKIGEMLNVATVLEGSVRKSSDKIRITAQLIKASDGSHLWSQTYDRKPDDILVIQDEIALAVANELKITLGITKESQKEKPWNEKALQLYQQGRYFFDRYGGPEDFKKAEDFFLTSLQQDSSKAIVYSYLTALAATRGDYIKANKYSNRAHLLDPMLGEPYAMDANRYTDILDFDSAFVNIKKAVQYGSASSQVMRISTWHFLRLGKFDEAMNLANRALELDPLQALGYRSRGAVYLYQGRYNEAIEDFKKAFGISPSLSITRVLFSESLLLSGNHHEALAVIEKETEETHRLYIQILSSTALKNFNRADSLMAIFKNKFSHEEAGRIGFAYAFMNRPDECFLWLEKAYKNKDKGSAWLADFLVSPLLNPVRKDPRYAAFKKKMNFPE